MFKTTGQTGTKILLDAMSKDKVHLARFVLDALDGEIVDSTAGGAQTPLISSVLLPDSQTRSARVCVCVCVCQPFTARQTPGVFLLSSGVLALPAVLAEQEGENLSGLSDNPDKAIFAVRENGTTCLMVEFAAKFLVPYDVLALNGIDLITEQASFTLPRGAEIEGKCGSTDSEIHISWKNNAYILRIYFSKEFREKGIEVWKINKIQFVYDTSETTHFINAYNPGKHTASTHKLSALVTPAGRSYVCTAQQTVTLISSDHQKGITFSMYDIQIQPFDIASDFIFSAPYKCITDQREHLEEILPLILGLILGLIIIITLTIYHFHLKLTANQPQLPRDRSMYKNM
ncbi:lysosome-associated membrane glycoprotein 5 isoform X2 [Poeciliopsis prolifica]|uniref:lysosome-associated membrane glycoprotein 5 isoform X2 n=1 Tax=Poeciliopsis prolifica TaxID=188132 RepID=UPI002412EBB6|nr:lysosome-associated membrane glycoprotein 5 isoform X2 [Poeciliopsis prolifica]